MISRFTVHSVVDLRLLAGPLGGFRQVIASVLGIIAQVGRRSAC